MMNALVPFNRLDEVFDSVFSPFRTRWTNGDAALLLTPRADILEGEKEYRIHIEMPGVDRKNLSIELEDKILTVSAKREEALPEGYQALHCERADRLEYRRTFTLGRGVDPEKVSARMENGILVLTLPKADQMLPRKIEVK